MVLRRDPLRLVDAYFRGEIDIEGDFFAVLGLKDRLLSIRMSTLDLIGAVFSALRLRSPHSARPGVAAAGDHHDDGHAAGWHTDRFEDARSATDFHVASGIGSDWMRHSLHL